ARVVVPEQHRSARSIVDGQEIPKVAPQGAKVSRAHRKDPPVLSPSMSHDPFGELTSRLKLNQVRRYLRYVRLQLASEEAFELRQQAIKLVQQVRHRRTVECREDISVFIGEELLQDRVVQIFGCHQTSTAQRYGISANG